MRYDTRVPFIPRIGTVLTVGFVWYVVIAIAAVITMFGATSIGDAISLALLAGLTGMVAAFSLKYRRDYLRWESNAQSSAPMVRRVPGKFRDDSEDRARAA